MTVLEQLSKLSSAEDFFQFLDVPFEPDVVHIARLHILRRMGDYIRTSSIETSEETLRENLRTHLDKAYQDFVLSTPLNERVFKVLKDAVRPKRQPLVALQIPGGDHNS
jgi:nitrogenase-stabilizing/protective protein